VNHRGLILLAFSALEGCGGCPPFAELEVTDPEGVATEPMLELVADVLAEFERWTGREGVCVSEVRLEPDLGEHQPSWADEPYEPSGLYDRRPGGDLILLDVGQASLSGTLNHELCHAVDLKGGRYSRRNRELFESAFAAKSYSWLSLDYPPDEVFAVLCAPGPDGLDVAAEAGCGLSPQEAFLLEEVFTGPWRQSHTWNALELAPRPLVLPEGTPTWVVAGAGTLVVGLVGPEEADAQRVSLLEISVETGVVDSFELSIAPGAPWILLGGDEGEDPLLVVIDGISRAWRVDLRADLLVEVPFPSEITKLHSGILSDGSAWLEADVGDGARDWYQVDLDSGELSPWLLPELHGGPGYWAAGGGVLSTYWNDGRDFWLATYNPPQDHWTLALSPGLTLRDTQPLPDGRTLFRWIAQRTGLSGFGWYDPVADLWTLGEEPCGEQRSSPSGSLLVVGGQPWWLEVSGGEAGRAYTLAPVVLP
jgi:hypothetical protein